MQRQNRFVCLGGKLGSLGWWHIGGMLWKNCKRNDYVNYITLYDAVCILMFCKNGTIKALDHRII